MKYYLMLTMVVLGVSSNAQPPQKMKERVATAIEKFNQGDTKALDMSYYDDELSEAATEFMKSLPMISNPSLSQNRSDSHRDFIIRFAIAIEKKSYEDRQHKRWSSNGPLLAVMINNLKADRDATARMDIARGLREMFSPDQLAPYAEAIIEAIHRWKDPSELILLYAVLPSANLETAQNLVKECGLQDHPYGDAALAKHGDVEAEARLYGRLDALKSSGTAEIKYLRESLEYVNTRTMMKRLGEGMKDNGRIPLAGGGWACKQIIYATALIAMNQDNLDFPLRTLQDSRPSPPKLDILEEWCTKNLQVQYGPKEGRKRCDWNPTIVTHP